MSKLNCSSLFALLAITTGAIASGQQQFEITSIDDIGKPKVCTKETCGGEYGTSLTFANSPAEAAKQALKDEKLVFVLHVSGNFETPDYT